MFLDLGFQNEKVALIYEINQWKLDVTTVKARKNF
jgi:hypothetical protein